MSSRGWKLAPVFAVTALLSAGCDDSSNNNQQDLSVPGDMAKAPGDMTAIPPDLLPGKGSGFFLAADVVGTAWHTVPDAGAETALPLAHTMVTAVQVPLLSAKNDYSDFVSDISVLKISGCFANRYSLGTKNPTPDSTTAGAMSITGYNTKVFVPTSTGVFSPDASTACVNIVTPLPNFACFYGTPGASAQRVSTVVYPTVDPVTYGQLCAGAGKVCTVADCLGTPTFCEPKLFLPDSIVKVAFAGDGTNYGAFSASYGADSGTALPQALHVTKITSGTTDFTSFDTITALDPAQDLSIEFSCDGSATPGSGCTTTGAFDLVVLSAQTSTTKRANFAAGVAPDFGVLTCIEQRISGKTKFTVKAAALQTMVGTQTGGSVSFAAMQVSALLGPEARSFHAAGRGSFGFANLK